MARMGLNGCPLSAQPSYCIKFLLPSSRHHLSYDDFLEDKREIVQTVLCCVLCATVLHCDKQFLKMSVVLGLGVVLCICICLASCILGCIAVPRT